MKYRVIRSDRASATLSVGDLLYCGSDSYGCADDDTRNTGVEHGSFSKNEDGFPFFTMPKEDAVPEMETADVKP